LLIRVASLRRDGEIVDGDEILRSRVGSFESDRLEQNTVVQRLSNFGLMKALAARGGKVVRTKVGDRYVH